MLFWGVNSDRPQLSNRLNTERDVYGVTIVDHKIFVIHEASNIISVFANSRPAEQLKDIVVNDMKEPIDMVGCNETLKLFVSDYDVIWRIDLKTNDQIQLISDFIKTTENALWTLSLSRGRLVVTADGAQSFFVYDIFDGQLLERIQLQSFVSHPQHAIRTRRGTFIVCFSAPRSDDGHWTEDEDEDHDQVSEVDGEGHVVRSLRGQRGDAGQHRFTIPWYLTIDSFGRVLVAEINSELNSGRIVLLTEDLKFDRILLDEKRGDFTSSSPVSPCYCERHKQLAVGLNDGNVNIYEWK